MAKKILCDRCGIETTTGYEITMPPKKQKDLCTQCYKELETWFKQCEVKKDE